MFSAELGSEFSILVSPLAKSFEGYPVVPPREVVSALTMVGGRR